MFIVVTTCIILFWVALGFCDMIFKSCMLHPYIVMLDKCGLTFKPFQAHWYTTQWNRCLQKWGCWEPHLVRKWFGVGAAVCTAAILPAVILLVVTAKGFITAQDAADRESQVLQPVVPGLNLPLSDIIYYIVTLLLCSVVHEFGHAAAAAREGVRIQGCGVFILGIIPGAFVDLPTEQVMVLSPWRQLKIFCAGVWHNVVLVLVAALLLLLNPYLATPFYQQGQGVSVISVDQASGIAGIAGLSSGDQILSVNTCPVSNLVSWKSCLIATLRTPQSGYCIPLGVLEDQVMHLPRSVLQKGDKTDCCNNSSQSDLCFQILPQQKYSCLPVRTLLHHAVNLCNLSAECGRGESCVVPIISDHTWLLQINRISRAQVLYLGSPADLWHEVTVSGWIPRIAFLSAWLVHVYEMFLQYIISFSGALALLNVIPCIALDGKWIAEALAELFLQRVIPNSQQRRAVTQVIIALGTCLLVVNVVLGLWSLRAV